MDSISELKEENRKLQIENSLLREEVIFLNLRIHNNEETIKEASNIIGIIPKDALTRDLFAEFHDSKEVIQIEEYDTNKKLSKFISESNNLSINEDNKILLGNKIVGVSKDDGFSYFLEKTVKILPFLIKLYSRYLGFTELSKNIQTYDYFGKIFFDDLEKMKKRKG